MMTLLSTATVEDLDDNDTLPLRKDDLLELHRTLRQNIVTADPYGAELPGEAAAVWGTIARNARALAVVADIWCENEQRNAERQRSPRPVTG